MWNGLHRRTMTGKQEGVNSLRCLHRCQSFSEIPSDLVQMQPLAKKENMTTKSEIKLAHFRRNFRRIFRRIIRNGQLLKEFTDLFRSVNSFGSQPSEADLFLTSRTSYNKRTSPYLPSPPASTTHHLPSTRTKKKKTSLFQKYAQDFVSPTVSAGAEGSN